MTIGSKVRMAAVLAVAALAAGNVSFANHFQGCNLLAGIPAIAGMNQGCPMPPQDDQPQELSGCAYGAYAEVTQPLTGATATLNNVAPSNFTTAAGTPAWPALSAPCPIYSGGLFTASNFVASAGLPVGPSPAGASVGVVTTQVEAMPFMFGPTGYSLASAETANVTVSVPSLSLSITADLIRAVAYCTKLAGPFGRNDDGPAGYGASTIAGLTISHPSLPGGSVSINVRPAEDTWIPIPGVGGIMLRETWDLEIPPYPGNMYKSFTENMIHLYLTNAVVTGDLVISQAHCDGMNLFGQPSQEPGHTIG